VVVNIDGDGDGDDFCYGGPCSEVRDGQAVIGCTAQMGVAGCMDALDNGRIKRFL
jgi:hypothetical protein